MALTEDKAARYRQQLREQETPEPQSPNAQELQDVWRHGNQRRPIPRNYSVNHKTDIVHLQHQWIQFCETMGKPDWKALLKTLTYENRGLGESFMRYLMLAGASKH